MFFKTALLSTLLLAFTVLAHPTSPDEQPQLVERSPPTQTAPQISGAGFNTQSMGSVTSMSAEFTLPFITSEGITSGVVGAMIDGIAEGDDQCFPILCGVQMIIDEDGNPFYQAVWQVANGLYNAIDPYAQISAGDRIKVTVEVNADRQSGVFTASGFWVVHTVPGLSLPNFGAVDMLVQGDVAGETINAQNAYIFNLQSGQASASISSDGETVSVRE